MCAGRRVPTRGATTQIQGALIEGRSPNSREKKGPRSGPTQHILRVGSFVLSPSEDYESAHVRRITRGKEKDAKEKKRVSWSRSLLTSGPPTVPPRTYDVESH